MCNIVRLPFKHRGVLLLVFASLMTLSSFAQVGTRNFTQFTELDGLPGSQVNSLIQDKFGYIRAGTINSLTRYNGYEFERFYSYPNNSTSIKTVQAKLFEHEVTFIRTKSFPENLYKYNSTKVLLTQPNCYCLYKYHFIINQNLSL